VPKRDASGWLLTEPEAKGEKLEVKRGREE